MFNIHTIRNKYEFKGSTCTNINYHYKHDHQPESYFYMFILPSFDNSNLNEGKNSDTLIDDDNFKLFSNRDVYDGVFVDDKEVEVLYQDLILVVGCNK